MGVAPAGTGLGEVEADTPRPKFSATSEKVVLIQWGVKPPNPLANRTLLKSVIFPLLE